MSKKAPPPIRRQKTPNMRKRPTSGEERAPFKLLKLGLTGYEKKICFAFILLQYLI